MVVGVIHGKDDSYHSQKNFYWIVSSWFVESDKPCKGMLIVIILEAAGHFFIWIALSCVCSHFGF